MKRYELIINGSIEIKRNNLNSILNYVYELINKKSIVIIDNKTKSKKTINNYSDYNKVFDSKSINEKGNK